MISDLGQALALSMVIAIKRVVIHQVGYISDIASSSLLHGEHQVAQKLRMVIAGSYMILDVHRFS
jgi:hypothetical protein